MNRKSQILIILLAFVYSSGWGQTEKKFCLTELDTITKRTVFISVDIEPHTPGGDGEILKHISTLDCDIQLDPIKDKFYIGFIVEKDGTLSSPRNLHGDTMSDCDLKIFSLLQELNWSPGQCDRENVVYLFKLPIRINLK